MFFLSTCHIEHEREFLHVYLKLTVCAHLFQAFLMRKKNTAVFALSSDVVLPFFLNCEQDPMWYHAKKPDGSQGMIPANYVIKRGEVRLYAMP